MIEALFSSFLGGARLRARIVEIAREASRAAASRQVDIHIMTFAFTDPLIAGLLEDIAKAHAAISVRIIADWSQGGPMGGRQIGYLTRLGLNNFRVRYKNDQPYLWDAAAGRLRWSYRASRGLLHHKTLGILVDGHPWKLVCGSFNWTSAAVNSYENLLVVSAEGAESRDLMRRVELEFEAMWCDGRVTLSPEEATQHYRKIVEEYKADPTKAPSAVVGLDAGTGETLPFLRSGTAGLEADNAIRAPSAEAGRALIAFSSRSPHDAIARHGYSEHNRMQRFELQKPSGRIKRVPLTLTTLALDVIFRAKPGDTLKVAMYALSFRVPEYAALLDAARRGVRVLILVDGDVGGETLQRLAAVRSREGLSLELRGGRRMMHQKYVVHPESDTVLTGTANMSIDASERHSEQRIRIRGNTALAGRFLSDFETIWTRLPRSL